MASALDKKGRGYPFLKTFFEDSPKTSYVIPNYQRNFEWNIENVDALFDDILNADVDLYIGHLLIKFGSNPGENEFAYNVCDGNQRMTVFFLILANLERLKVLPNDEIERIHNMIHYKKRWRLRLNASDHRLFMKLLEKPVFDDNYSPDECRKLLYQVYARIEQKIKELSDRNVELLWKNLCGCKCTFYSLDKDDDEHDIFAKINAEKKALSEYTMIRQYLLNVDDADFNGIFQYITEMDNYIEEVDETLYTKNQNKLQMIRNEFISYYVKIVRHGIINDSRRDDYKYYHAYRKYLKDNDNIDKKVAAEEICKYAKIYHDIKIAIYNGTLVEGVDIYGAAQAVGIKACIPLLMRMLYERHEVPTTPLSDNDVQVIMKYLTSYLVRGKFLGYRAKGQVQDSLMYTGIHRSISDSASDGCSVSECFIQKCKNTLSDYPMPKDNEVIDAIMADNQIGKNGMAFVKYVLTTVENTLCDEPVNTSKSEVDHIHPKNATSEDLVSYGWTKEEHLDNVFRLGNLGLLTSKKNGGGKKTNKMGMISAYYKDSRLKTNEFVKKNANKWSPKAIREHTKELAYYVVETFPEM